MKSYTKTTILERTSYRALRIAILAVLGFTSPCWSDEPIAARRDRIGNMSSTEKQELQEKRDRFNRLPKEEQQRLRDLHERIKQHEDSARLQAVLDRYGEWLKTVSAMQRADLRKMPVDERIKKIRETKRRFEEERFGRFNRHDLKHQDVRIVFDWLDDEVAPNLQDQLEKMLTDRDRRFLNMFDDEPKRRVMMLKRLYWRSPEILENLSSAQIEKLVNRLSIEARNKYRGLPDADQQRRLVGQWIQGALTSRSAAPRIDEQELERFFGTLDPELRGKLTKMPRDRMYRELGRMYFMQNRAGRFGGQRPGDGPPHFRRPRRGGDERGRDRRRSETPNEERENRRGPQAP